MPLEPDPPAELLLLDPEPAPYEEAALQDCCKRFLRAARFLAALRFAARASARALDLAARAAASAPGKAAGTMTEPSCPVTADPLAEAVVSCPGAATAYAAVKPSTAVADSPAVAMRAARAGCRRPGSLAALVISTVRTMIVGTLRRVVFAVVIGACGLPVAVVTV